MFLRQVLALLAKDLTIEWRSKDVVLAMSVFSLSIVVIANFALGANTELARTIAPGILWLALLFATVLGLQRAGDVESDDACLSGLLLAVRAPSVLFVAKTLTHIVYLTVVSVGTLPLYSLWFRIDLTERLGAFSLALLLGVVGLSIVGTLFSMLTLQMRTRDVLLPLLFFPVSVPLTIAAVYATVRIVEGKQLADITEYLTLMGVFDVVFLVLAWLVFDYVVEE